MAINEGAITGGFHRVNKVGGSPTNEALTPYQIKNGYASNIFNGDPVIVSAGFLQLAPAGVTSPTTGPVGVFSGCTYIDNATKSVVFSPYFPANTSSGGFVDGYSTPVAYVADAADAQYLMVGTTSISADKIGGIFKVSAIGSGSSANGQSLCKVDILASAGTSAGALVRVIGLANIPGNELGISNPQLLVKLYNDKYDV